MAADQVAMFRFLLEAYDNLACFTVLERRPALLKISFSLESRPAVENALRAMQATVDFEWRNWPSVRESHDE